MQIRLSDNRDGAGSNLSDMELRLLYSVVVVRSVNSLVDNYQQKYFAESVMSLASNIGIPAWIVELRHDATHGELPSLSLLRTASASLMDWLVKQYWSLQTGHLNTLSGPQAVSSILADDIADEDDSEDDAAVAAVDRVSPLVVPDLVRQLEEAGIVMDNNLASFLSVAAEPGSAAVVVTSTYEPVIPKKLISIASLWEKEWTGTCLICFASARVLDLAQRASDIEKTLREERSDERVHSDNWLLEDRFPATGILRQMYLLIGLIKLSFEKSLPTSSVASVVQTTRRRLLFAIWGNSTALAALSPCVGRLISVHLAILLYSVLSWKDSVVLSVVASRLEDSGKKAGGKRRVESGLDDISNDKTRQKTIADPVPQVERGSHRQIWPLGLPLGKTVDSSLLYRIEFDHTRDRDFS